MAQSTPITPTVLIVEDETLVRMFACDIASDAGYRVIEASNAREALVALEANPEIGIVFTDIHMDGGMNGLQLAHAVRDRWPPMRFIVVSGHMKVAADQLPAESRFFSKPYEVSEITDALGRLATDWRGASPV